MFNLFKKKVHYLSIGEYDLIEERIKFFNFNRMVNAYNLKSLVGIKGGKY